MNKKIITIMLCVSFLTLGATTAIAKEEDQILEKYGEQLEKLTKDLDENFTLPPNFFTTVGPVSKMYSHVKILNGSQIQTKMIQRHLDRKLLKLGMFLPTVVLLVTEMDFEVSYSKTPLLNTSRFSYSTLNATAVLQNGTLVNVTNITKTYNIMHKVRVENLTGFFIFERAKFFRLFGMLTRHLFFAPATFSFIGYCNNVTYVPVLF